MDYLENEFHDLLVNYQKVAKQFDILEARQYITDEFLKCWDYRHFDVADVFDADCYSMDTVHQLEAFLADSPLQSIAKSRYQELYCGEYAQDSEDRVRITQAYKFIVGQTALSLLLSPEAFAEMYEPNDANDCIFYVATKLNNQICQLGCYFNENSLSIGSISIYPDKTKINCYPSGLSLPNNSYANIPCKMDLGFEPQNSRSPLFYNLSEGLINSIPRSSTLSERFMRSLSKLPNELPLADLALLQQLCTEISQWNKVNFKKLQKLKPQILEACFKGLVDGFDISEINKASAGEKHFITDFLATHASYNDISTITQCALSRFNNQELMTLIADTPLFNLSKISEGLHALSMSEMIDNEISNISIQVDPSNDDADIFGLDKSL
ncbi:hypothetical protein [Shewanella aestuarii]|uniref:Uncharacterized protein n=1 Tax=Shewanella aestuarii TaxID=1028752 RepID=A0A6G9QQ51_9GAMM|nr:hypothetical protein [Shewanella aestuarii]QIR16548.1 hypothetical protein HBH39_18915 [Shewanella aestuarii]